MSSMLQLNPPLCVYTPQGKGYAHIIMDYGLETDLFFVVFLDTTGICWIYPNKEVRIEQNLTIGRKGNPFTRTKTNDAEIQNRESKSIEGNA